MMKHKLIASALCFIAGILVSALFACTTGGQPSSPDANGIQAIQTACAVDAVGRPIADLLLLDLTPVERAAVDAGRKAIDAICANPAGDVRSNTMAALAAATGDVGRAFAAVRARKLVEEAQAHGAPPPPQ